jgi:hypothetical protein
MAQMRKVNVMVFRTMGCGGNITGNKRLARRWSLVSVRSIDLKAATGFSASRGLDRSRQMSVPVCDSARSKPAQHEVQ